MTKIEVYNHQNGEKITEFDVLGGVVSGETWELETDNGTFIGIVGKVTRVIKVGAAWDIIGKPILGEVTCFRVDFILPESKG